jgi:hypothetical protein
MPLSFDALIAHAEAVERLAFQQNLSTVPSRLRVAQNAWRVLVV